jgi:hypothetical protein
MSYSIFYINLPISIHGLHSNEKIFMALEFYVNMNNNGNLGVQ